MRPASFPPHFRDRIAPDHPGVRDLLRVLATGGFGSPTRAALVRRRVPRVQDAVVPHTPEGTTLTWVGHASFIVQTGGLVVLTDPVWSRLLPGGYPRITGPGIPWERVPKVDAVVISHNHYDHLDAATLKRLPRDVACFVPANLGGWFRRLGFSKVHEMDWWESVEHEGVEFAFVPAKHWSRRGLRDENRSLWGGWVITPPGDGRVYFAGDSGWFDGFAQIGAKYPGIDVALMPIGAYAPDWFMRSVHMNPEEAVQAFLEVGARRFVPMHWGTFALTREPFLEPRERLLAAWEREHIPSERLVDLALGESRSLLTTYNRR